MDCNAMTFLYKNNMNCHEKKSNRLTKPNHHLSKQSSPTDLISKKWLCNFWCTGYKSKYHALLVVFD